MQLAHALARGATAPIRIGLSAGSLGLSVARMVVDEARRALLPDPPVPDARPRVDDDPVPVAEFGEAGVAEGAGAEVHIDPPWDGYDGMTAARIRQRLAEADGEVAAAVSLYEGARRGRRSVLDAADRRLRAVTS